jgi:hypothetical protein
MVPYKRYRLSGETNEELATLESIAVEAPAGNTCFKRKKPEPWGPPITGV